MLPRGVILVFCILFVVFLGTIALVIRNLIVKRRAASVEK